MQQRAHPPRPASIPALAVRHDKPREQTGSLAGDSAAGLRGRACGAHRAGCRDTAAHVPGAEPAPHGTNAPAVDAATLCLVNEVRSGARPAARCVPTGNCGRVAASQVDSMVARDYFADDRARGADAAVAGRRHPLPSARCGVRGRAEHRLGHRQLHDPGAHRGRMDGLAAAPRNHAQREYRDAGVAVTPAIPAVLDAGPRAPHTRSSSARALELQWKTPGISGAPARAAGHASAFGAGL